MVRPLYQCPQRKQRCTKLVPVQVKIQQAQDLIKQMNEKLSFTLVKFENKQKAHDRNLKQLSDLRWEEQWSQRCAMVCHPCVPFQYMYHDGNCKNDVHPTTEEQDELIRKLRYKLLHKSTCFAEEKKLIRQIADAEEIREALVANPKPKVHSRYYAGEAQAAQVYRAKLQKKKYEKKVLEELDPARRKLRSMEENRKRMNEKKSRVHKIIYDLVKQQDQVTESHQWGNIISAADS